MSQFTLEKSGSSEGGPCPCCGNLTQTIWGYVHAGKPTRAVYYARWTPGHIEDGASFILGIGKWGDAPPSERKAVALACRTFEKGPEFMVVDAATSPWGAGEFLGAMLTREQALSSPIRQEAFDLIDFIVVNDDRIKSFLYGSPT